MTGRTAERRAFLPIGEDALDDAAERVALAKNIPTLTPPRSQMAEAMTATGTEPPEAPVRGIASTVQVSAGEQAGPEPDENRDVKSGFTQIRVRCPNYLSDQLVLEQQRIRREGQRVTLNYLILCALEKAGYRIEEKDLVEDGRRLRS
ncbi:MAG: hypothetical protein WAN86_22470 [Hyphomicrobiaceae bacterium]